MKVLLMGNYKPDQQQSMLLFGDALYNEFLQQNLDVEMWHPPKVVGFGKPGTTLGKYLAYIDKFIIGSLLLRFKSWFGGYDIYHILDHSNSMYSFFLPKNRTITSCHDCIAIDEALSSRTGENVGKFGKVLQTWIVRGLERSKSVCSVSQATKRDLVRLTNRSVDDIQFIYNSPFSEVSKLSETDSSAIFQKNNLPTDTKFIFSLGNNLIRKNRKGTIQAYFRFRELGGDPELKLWIAGKPFDDEIDSLVNASAYAEDIRYVGEVDVELLAALYSRCEIFAFPSIDEGFGVPIVEGQLCGALVITSDKEPMSEVAGEAAILVDPYSIESMANAFLHYQETAEEVKSHNAENADKYSKHTMAQNYLNEYQRVLGL